MKFSNKKKILFVISDFGPGGAQRVLSNLANSLVNREYDVYVFLFSNIKPFYKLNKKIKLIQNDMVKENNGLLNKLFFNLKKVMILKSFLQNVKPDTTISFIFETNVITILSKLGVDTKLIISERNNPYHQKGNFIWNLLRKITYFIPKFIVVNNRFAFDYFLKSHKRKIILVNNPIKKHKKIIIKKEKNILVVSRLHSQKSLDDIIMAYSYITKEFRDWKLTIVGEGEKKTHLHNLAKRFDIYTRIKWVEKTKDISKFYSKSSIFCLPSKFEGESNSLLEALYYNLPCIVSNRAVHPDDEICKYLTIYKFSDVDELIKALRMHIKKKVNIKSSNFIMKNNNLKSIIDKWVNLIKHEN